MRNIIITGGELFNKGAQSMVFITVNELKQRFPNHEILVLSPMDLQRPKGEKNNYNFKFIGWFPPKFAKCQNNLVMRSINKLRHRIEYKECEKIYKNCDMMIDISGYALGSNWGEACCNVFLEHLEFAKAFHIPFYLMPQSFGPFSFKGKAGKQIENRIRNVLPKAQLICAREKEGLLLLQEKYKLENVCLMTDIVLNNKEIDLCNIYKQIPEFDIPDVKENSIGIIPNGQTAVVSNKERILALYKTIIEELLEERKKIYLLSHATADRTLCREIKDLFEMNDDVVFLDKDFSCIEFNEIVKKFYYIIASRFHSIVHAYKNSIPCISMGWAVKYQELLEELGQEEYAFDVRNEIDDEKMIKKIQMMNENREREVKKIKERLELLQKDNVFDVLLALDNGTL